MTQTRVPLSRAERLEIYRTSYPVPERRPVTEGHAEACELFGHAVYAIDGIDQGICPRCGEVTETGAAPTAAMLGTVDADTPAEIIAEEIASARSIAALRVEPASGAAYRGSRVHNDETGDYALVIASEEGGTISVTTLSRSGVIGSEITLRYVSRELLRVVIAETLRGIA